LPGARIESSILEIDPEKNPYGGWERSKRRRLGAFLSGLTRLQRLWLVAAAVYLALVAATGFLLMPDRGQAERCRDGA